MNSFKKCINMPFDILYTNEEMKHAIGSQTQLNINIITHNDR